MISTKISKPICFHYSFSTDIISNTIKNVFNIIKILGFSFDIKPYIFINSYIFKLKESRDFIVVTYKVKENSSFLRKVEIKIPIINNIKCNIKYKLNLSYYENTCEKSTLVVLENDIKYNTPLTKIEKDEIEIIKNFFFKAKFEEFFEKINQMILKEDFEIELNASGIINKPLDEIYNYLKDSNNVFNTLNIFQKYEKNFVSLKENNNTNIVLIKTGKDIVKYKINYQEKDDEHFIIFYKKNINGKESINNFTCFKVYSLNENFSLIICQTSLNITYKTYNESFIKLLSHWVKRIKNKFEKI